MAIIHHQTRHSVFTVTIITRSTASLTQTPSKKLEIYLGGNFSKLEHFKDDY